MGKFITRYSLSRFDELVPLLMRCFPEFWEPRLKQGMRSFPYDLRLFTARQDGQLIGCIGLHGYPFLLDDGIIECFGVSDVAVDPDSPGLRRMSSLIQKRKRFRISSTKHRSRSMHRITQRLIRRCRRHSKSLLPPQKKS